MSKDAIDIKIKNMDELQEALKRLGRVGDGSKLRGAAEAGMRVVEGNAVVNIGQKFSSRSQGSLAGNRSLTVAAEKGKAIAKLVFHSIHARIQEFGGTIKPVKAKYLAIPQTDTARKVGSPRNYPGDLRFKSGGDGGVLIDGSGTVVYVLKKRVTLPPRPYLRPAMNEHTQEIEAAMTAEIRQEIEEAARG